MKLSRWTIIAPIPGRDTALLVQPLSGEVALLEAAEAAAPSAQPSTLPAGLDQASLCEMRIVVDSDEEDARLLAEAQKASATTRPSRPGTGVRPLPWPNVQPATSHPFAAEVAGPWPPGAAEHQ